jgi:hypothetical protein
MNDYFPTAPVPVPVPVVLPAALVDLIPCIAVAGTPSLYEIQS